MLFSILIATFSTLLEAFLSNYISIFVGSNNYFIPMFTIVSLIIIFPYFNEASKFLKICSIFGLIYDILFTNTLGLNLTLFILIGLIIIFLDNALSNTLFSIIIKMLIILIIYDSLTYFILILLNYINYDFTILLMKIAKSILINLIYIIILYLTTNFIADRFSIKKAN